MKLRRVPTVVLLGALPLALASCGGDDEGAGGGGGESEITVLAAASLTETFTELAEQFEADHEGVTVTLAFDSSATLAEQAIGGAPADVLATADTVTMQTAVDGEAVAEGPDTFATNVLTVALAADNPAGIEAFEDLGEDGVTYVACVDTAPCGAVAATLLGEAALGNDPASLEVDVKAVLGKVTQGEADAGLVYVTDAQAADLETVEIPGADAEILEYPIAVLEQSEEADLAQEFVDLVLSEDGQSVLSEAGFGAP